MKRFLFLFLLTGPAALGQALDSTQTAGIPPKSNYRFSIISETGFTLASTSTPNMQAFFRQNQIKRAALVDAFVHLNAGVRYYRLKLMLETGYGADFDARREQSGPVVQRTYARYSAWTLGYDLLNGRNHRLYLNAGVGSINYEYSVFGRSGQSVALQNLTQYAQPGDIASLKLNNTYWDVNLELTQREKHKRSIATALRVGYRRGWGAQAWESGAFQLTNAPVDRISQVYLLFSFCVAKNYPVPAK